MKILKNKTFKQKYEMFSGERLEIGASQFGLLEISRPSGLLFSKELLETEGIHD